MRKKITVLTLVMLAVVVGAGCPDMNKESRDAKHIMDSVEIWKAGVEAGHSDKMMAICGSVKSAIGQNFFEGAKVDLANAKTTIVNIDHATVAPVVINGNGAKLTLELELLKEKGHWYVLFVREK